MVRWRMVQDLLKDKSLEQGSRWIVRRGYGTPQELERKGIIAMARGRTGLDEEQPDAYKDVNEVVDVVHRAGLSRRVCRMKPMGVIKG